jgi:hypothetical protein
MGQSTNSGVAIGEELLVPGPTIRKEYLKLPGDLAVLARSFGIALPPQLQRDAAVLAFSIECADRSLDAISQADRRVLFGNAILAHLEGSGCSDDGVTVELAGWLAQLREVIERHQIHGAYYEIVGELLSNSEQMRTTRNHARFVCCAVKEGRLMVQLLLLILEDNSTPQFDSFMRQLSEPANLGDKLRDAHRDYQRGEIAIRPTWKFRARLAWEIFWRVLRLARSCAWDARLMTWGMGSVFTEFFWFRFSRSHSP